MKSTACVILAAGLGKRMKSSAPKVLAPLFDKPLIQYVLEASDKLKPEKTIIVTGKHGELVKQEISSTKAVIFAKQKDPKGTAHALLCAKQALRGFKGTVVVLNGDSPLITAQSLKKLLSLHRRHKNHVSVGSFLADNPLPYGRILRDPQGKAVRIIEGPDASEAEADIAEVNSGIYAIEAPALSLLSEIRLNRKKGEYYLTDIFETALGKGKKANAYCLGREDEFAGINTASELAFAHKALSARHSAHLMAKGVSFIDPSSVYIAPWVKVGAGTTIYPNVFIHGDSTIGKGCTIYPNVRIVQSTIKDNTLVLDSSLIEGSTVGPRARVGPFAHLRPGATIAASAMVGNFVEVKKSFIGQGSKALHMSYIGDTELGRNVNIGAGTITCNYDGANKHKTTIGDGVFIGSGTQLVAPVRVGKGSYVGAGSTITKDVPPDSLALTRARTKTIRGWPKKRREEAASKSKITTKAKKRPKVSK